LSDKPFFEPLSARDAWFLYAERPETPLDIGTVYVFEGQSQVPGGRGALGVEETVRERIHLVPRYRQCIHRVPFNLAHPERTRALLIIDTGPGYKSDEAREGWNRNALNTAAKFETEGLGRLAGGSVEMRTSTHRNAEGLARAARGMLTQKDARVISSLPEVKVPALVLVGANDTPFLNASSYMTAKIPGAKQVIIPNAGHAANIDQPEAFNAAVLGFLAETGLA